jgi:GDP-L-fucose synthase
MDFGSKIYVTGHNGMVGRALVKQLHELGYQNILTVTSKDLDLRNLQCVQNYFDENQPEYVFHLAAKVGGIKYNMSNPTEFLLDNLQIQNNVISSSFRANVKKLLFLSSSCVYPRDTDQPMQEEQILTGRFEPTNEQYAVAKIAGMKLCEAYNKQYSMNFVSAIPPNLYGFHDNFHQNNSHVLAALLRKFILAKDKSLDDVEIWGTGIARREFLFVSDLADGLIFLMKNYNNIAPINIGSGDDISIKRLAILIKDVVNYNGDLTFNTKFPDGMPQKLLNVNKLNNLGWKAKTTLKEGIEKTYHWIIENQINFELES